MATEVSVTISIVLGLIAIGLAWFVASFLSKRSHKKHVKRLEKEIKEDVYFLKSKREVNSNGETTKESYPEDREEEGNEDREDRTEDSELRRIGSDDEGRRSVQSESVGSTNEIGKSTKFHSPPDF